MIEISEVTYHFDKKAIGALNNINLRIKQGDVHVDLKPKWFGKTTLLNLINGEFALQKGEIKIDSDKSISKLEQSDNVLNKTVHEFVL